MEATQTVIYDSNLLSRITSFLDDHFDLLNLSKTSKFHRQVVLHSVKRITVRNLFQIHKLPQDVPNVTSLNINLLEIKLTQEAFDDLMSHLPDLEVLTINSSSPYNLNLRSVGKLSQLRVLNVGRFEWNDEVAEAIGKGCTLLQDLTIDDSYNALSKDGWSDLLFGSKLGLRRLSVKANRLEEDVFLLFLQCSSLTSLSVVCKTFEFSNPGNKMFDYMRVELKNLREIRLDLYGFNEIIEISHLRSASSDNLTNYVSDLCNAIIDCGARLEVFDCHNSSYETVRTLCQRMPLRSCRIYSQASRFFEEHLISIDSNLLSLMISQSSNATNKAIIEKIAEVEGIRKGLSNAEMGIVPDSFLQGLLSVNIGFSFGVYENFSCKSKFLQEFTLEVVNMRSDYSYPGLKELFSTCTLLKKVSFRPSLISGKENLGRRNILLALEALSNCHKLEDLSAPVGDETLSKILRGVKGLQRLTVEGPLEVFSDESALLLATNTPFLRYFKLSASSIELQVQRSGVTQRGLEALSSCSRLQTLELSNFELPRFCLKQVTERCIWLNRLSLRALGGRGATSKRSIAEDVQILKDRGCDVLILCG